MPFSTEQQLFEIALASPFIRNLVDSLVYTTFACIEPQGLFGIPDLVIANIEYELTDPKIIRSFAFEMKLSNWKRALIQAYRYLAFSNYSFVVIDRSSQKPALNHISEFVQSNIGLISVDKSGFLSLHYYPQFNTPYSYNMERKLTESLLGHNGKTTKQSSEMIFWNHPNLHYEKIF